MSKEKGIFLKGKEMWSATFDAKDLKRLRFKETTAHVALSLLNREAYDLVKSCIDRWDREEAEAKLVPRAFEIFLEFHNRETEGT